MNKELSSLIRVRACDLCKMSIDVEPQDVCITASGPTSAEILVVVNRPLSTAYRRNLELDLADAGVDISNCAFTSVIKCRNWDEEHSNSDVKICGNEYLTKEIDFFQPKWILAMGNEALRATTGKSGIMKHRSKAVDIGGLKVFPTISAASVNRNPGQRQGYQADLNLFSAMVAGRASGIEVPKIQAIMSEKHLWWLSEKLHEAELLSYDVETVGPYESHPDARIVSLSGTMEMKSGEVIVWALPLFHPQSPFKDDWVEPLVYLKDALEAPRKKIAQNGKYDARWLRQHNVQMSVTFDTMLAAHLLDENREKGLKPQAMSRLGVPYWGIDTKNLLNTPLKQVLKYNALDTFYTYHIYRQLKEELMEQARLMRIFRLTTTPANNLLIGVERRGVHMDRELLHTNAKISDDMRAEIDRQLMEWVPQGEERELYAKGWPGKVLKRVKGDRLKLNEINFNTSDWLRWWLFDYLELPVLALTKTGKVAVNEAVMLELKGKHPAVDLMLERAKWQKYCSAFFGAYLELISDEDRIHTTFKIAGTVTGRLSSGKEDEEKISATKDRRGINFQQVPRDPFVRGVFSAPPGWMLVEADFSQIELRIIAFLSRDRTMMHLYQTGQDVHKMTAASVLGVPMSQITKDDRKSAKAVNFGFAYGMYEKKFIQTAFTKYGLVVSYEEAKAYRAGYFNLYKGLLPWHNRQKRLVHANRRVQNPIGRIRHLPDIESGDKHVRMEAERQAINSPVQSFGSDLCMLSMIEVDAKFRQLELAGFVVGTVHDSLIFEIREDELRRALPLIKQTMEHLPLRKKFGLNLDVPIVVDFKVGSWWGKALELTEEEVWDYRGLTA